MNRIDAILSDIGIRDRLTILKIHYALEILKNEVTKMIILLVLFAVLGNIKECIFAMLILLPVRTFSGGMHMKTNAGCFFYSLAFFVLAIKILPLLVLPVLAPFVLIAVSAVLLAILSPVASHKRPIKTAERYAAMKRNTIIFLIIDCSVLSVLWGLNISDYFVIGVWVIVLQSLQVAMTRIFRALVKEKKNVKEAEKVEPDDRRIERA